MAKRSDNLPARNDQLVGRGAQIRPANRFERVHVELEPEASNDATLDEASSGEGGAVATHLRRLPTQFLPDDSQSILSSNDSPDVGFKYSINPYRGCEHGCAYCYARPSHEYLGLDAGLDFETRVLVKYRAPELLKNALAKPSWKGEVIVFSGVTDCYQPAEREFRLTRGCLEVLLAHRQAMGIVTKNALVTREIDLLVPMATQNLAEVNISVTSLDPQLARTMEPRTSLPRQRLEAIRQLSAAGIPVRALVAPIIPGLNDREIPAILQAVREAGARSASYVLLRLPLAVRPIFHDWLERSYPDKLERIESLIRSTRSGKLNNSEFGTRHRGVGAYADQIAGTFEVFRRKLGLDAAMLELDTSLFRRPEESQQRTLFD